MLNKYELRQLILEAYLNSEIDKDTAIERIKLSGVQFNRILSQLVKFT